MVLEAIRYDRKQKSLHILNQLKLPHVEEFDAIVSTEDAWDAIKSMRVRGAPAIAIVAALSLASDLAQYLAKSPITINVNDTINDKLDYLITSRPTAVNLSDAVRKLKKAVNAAAKRGAGAEELIKVYIQNAEQMLADDVRDNEAIGRYGADWIVEQAKKTERIAGRDRVNGDGESDVQVAVLTHCNTGSLATAGYGTALGVIRSLQEKGALHHAYCTETRPYNQGARLTAFELVHDKLPATLITDSMAGAALAGSQRVAAIVVGADRVAANGDTANKIGTYSLAVLARYHGVKFLVAAPRTTIDLSTESGANIVIEERKPEEVTTIRGAVMSAETGRPDPNRSETICVAATGIGVWNPAFDVTPGDLIDGIVTEVGVFEKENGRFDLSKAFEK